MRAFVTGGAGVIGRELVSRLIESGDSVSVCDRVEKPSWMPSEAEYIQADVNTLTVLPSCDQVYHLAASFERLGESPEHWMKNWDDNVQGAHHVFSMCVRAGVRVVFASSYLVYGNYPNVMLDPRNLTGAAKLYSEKELEYLGKVHGLKYAIARIYRVYGRGSKDVISSWARAALRKEQVRAYTLDNKFDFIHARDVARILSILPDGVHHVGTGRMTRISSVLEIFKISIEKFPLNIDFKEKGEREFAFTQAKESGCTLIERGVREIIEYERGLL